MFCSNCGKQIPDNTKFCNYCGGQQQIMEDTAAAPKTAENQPNAVDAQPQAEKKAPKKKANIFIILAVVLGAFLLGRFVIAPSMVSDSGKDNNTRYQGGQTQQTNENNDSPSLEVNNPAYDAIFDGTYIVHFQSFFNMDMESDAMKKGDGMIACADYGYQDDVVKQWVETVYIPVSEYTDAQKAEIETTMRAQFASIDALNCCAVTYNMGTNYFTVTCTYSDVDKAENYGELYNTQILQTNTFISMSATETNLLAQGFVKK